MSRLSSGSIVELEVILGITWLLIWGWGTGCNQEMDRGEGRAGNVRSSKQFALCSCSEVGGGQGWLVGYNRGLGEEVYESNTPEESL